MIETVITAARLCGAVVLCVYFGGVGAKMVAESLAVLQRQHAERRASRLDRYVREPSYRIPTPPPPPPRPAKASAPPLTDPRDEPPPQGCSAEERAEMLAAIDYIVQAYRIKPCRICANWDLDCEQYPCRSCTGGEYFVAKWRRDGEVVRVPPLPIKEQR